ncbi:MAG: flagellar export chaperone FliS [Oscillospiraceae bacterium]|nr:flagellar export chaperone FliS [Oscillospiraceae bacterium]
MYTKGFQQYKEQSIDTMTPSELLLTLYDELVKRLTRAEIALEKGDYEMMEQSVQRAAEIIRYLRSTLDRSYEISKNLAQLYEFFTYELMRVKAGRNATELQRVKTMVSELRDAFRTAAANSASGK